VKNSFEEKVYKLCRSIPKGKVAIYGQLARLAGNRKAARAVGYYMKTNEDVPHTPCHRVVAADGSLTGYSGRGGIAGKRKMLIREGVQFKKNKVDLGYSLWKKSS